MTTIVRFLLLLLVLVLLYAQNIKIKTHTHVPIPLKPKLPSAASQMLHLANETEASHMAQITDGGVGGWQ